MTPPYVLEFEIGGLPRMTNPSGRPMHWAVRAEEARRWRTMVTALVGRRRPPKPLAKALLTLTRFSSVSPDSDGLVSGFKHVIDGLVDAGVLENDRFENIGMPIYVWSKAKPGNGRIRIRVAEITKHMAPAARKEER